MIVSRKEGIHSSISRFLRLDGKHAFLYIVSFPPCEMTMDEESPYNSSGGSVIHHVYTVLGLPLNLTRTAPLPRRITPSTVVTGAIKVIW